jgi:hypothetical protein
MEFDEKAFRCMIMCVYSSVVTQMYIINCMVYVSNIRQSTVSGRSCMYSQFYGGARVHFVAMPPSKAILCIFLVLPPLTESSASPPAPALATALADARMAEPEAVARALTEVVRINPNSDSADQGGWLADLAGFDSRERQELSDLLREEGVGLGDRSKLRRVTTTTAQSTVEDNAFGLPRRVQQAGGREDSQGACTAQPSSEQAGDDSGLSGDSASLFSLHLLDRPTICSTLAPNTKVG